MKWSEEAWGAAEPVYRRVLELDFIRELMAGTLSRERFMFYIRQDAQYLVDFGKALAAIAGKHGRMDYRQAFLSFSGDCMVAEKALHDLYLQREEVTAIIEQSPSCLLYTSYILRQLQCAPVEVAMAAVLPCFWVYKEVGEYIAANQNREGNPYQAWIDMYGGEEFTASVQRNIDICDDVARECTEAQRRGMTDAYVMCTKLEWMFWDSAYRLEGWRV